MRLVVVGTGLIGGSFALAAREAGLFEEIVGVEPDAGRARRAQALNLVDAVVEAVPDAADAVLLAGPSHTIAPWVIRLADHAGIVFDAGSVKEAVLDAVRTELGGLPPRFVPCHPLAGSERSGPEAATGALFRNAEVIVTPDPQTDRSAAAEVGRWWRALGARVTNMPAHRHDQILAVTSHLPHLVAFAYLQQVDDDHLRHAAGGFRDFSRIGAADADMWSPIFTLNRQAVLAALGELEASLEQMRRLLEAGDEAGLARLISAAAARRRRLDHDG